MKNHGICSGVHSEVSVERIAELLGPDRAALGRLIDETGRPPR